MRRFVALLVVLLVCVGAMVYRSNRPMHAQAQVSGWQTGTFYEPVGSVAVSAWTPVSMETCSQAEACVVPHTGTSISSGIAIESGQPGQYVHVVNQGRVECTFDNQ